jgi:hypothetical protein
MINKCWQPNTFAGNCFVDNGSIVWPEGNITSVESYSVLFTDYNDGDGGDYTIASGSPCKADGWRRVHLHGRIPKCIVGSYVLFLLRENTIGACAPEQVWTIQSW